jgi:acyl-CoA reductase-like NAD-dependent aldehyde dehydrogenase
METYPLTIGGESVSTSWPAPVNNPADHYLACYAATCISAQLDIAMDAADRSFQEWSRLPVALRQRYLNDAADRVKSVGNELAQLQTAEQGRPISESCISCQGMAGLLRYYAAIDIPTLVLGVDGDKKVTVRHQPVGGACITPWNSPAYVVDMKLPPALLTGNTVVLKPSLVAPLGRLRREPAAKLKGRVRPAYRPAIRPIEAEKQWRSLTARWLS